MSLAATAGDAETRQPARPAADPPPATRTRRVAPPDAPAPFDDLYTERTPAAPWAAVRLGGSVGQTSLGFTTLAGGGPIWHHRGGSLHVGVDGRVGLTGMTVPAEGRSAFGVRELAGAAWIVFEGPHKHARHGWGFTGGDGFTDRWWLAAIENQPHFYSFYDLSLTSRYISFDGRAEIGGTLGVYGFGLGTFSGALKLHPVPALAIEVGARARASYFDLPLTFGAGFRVRLAPGWELGMDWLWPHFEPGEWSRHRAVLSLLWSGAR